MRILITNDDGFEAPGIRAVYNELKKVDGLELSLIAPTRNRTAASRAVTVNRNYGVTKVPDDNVTKVSSEGPHVIYKIDGKPVDCVVWGMNHLYRASGIDFIVSGINDGPNMGPDTIHSGTIGAAEFGASHGVPSIAVSIGTHDRKNQHLGFAHGAQYIRRFIEQELHAKIPQGNYLNVNVPNIATINGVEITEAADYLHYVELTRPATDKEVIEESRRSGKPIDPHATYFVNTSTPLKIKEHKPGTDYDAISRGYISVTPFIPARTSMGALDSMDIRDFDI